MLFYFIIHRNMWLFKELAYSLFFRREKYSLWQSMSHMGVLRRIMRFPSWSIFHYGQCKFASLWYIMFIRKSQSVRACNSIRSKVNGTANQCRPCSLLFCATVIGHESRPTGNPWQILSQSTFLRIPCLSSSTFIKFEFLVEETFIPDAFLHFTFNS